MRIPRSPVAKPRCCRSQSVANAAKRTQAPAAITMVAPQLQVPSTRGARKRARTLHSRNQRTREASSTRAAMPAAAEILRLGREHLPVDARPPVGREHERDLIERKASGAPERDQRQAFEHAGIKHTTQAPPADRRDQPLFLVEP